MKGFKNRFLKNQTHPTWVSDRPWLPGSPIQANETTLLSGVHGNIQTIALMKRLARQASHLPKVRFRAIEILNQFQTQPNDYRDESLSIGQWVKQNVRYIRDASQIEQLTHPVLMLDLIEQGQARGDCDDMSLLIASLLLSIGHQPSFRAVRYEGNRGPFHHIYVVDHDRNHGEREFSRIVLDAILRDHAIGTEVPHASGQDYPI